jgi:hypothetical protein
LVTERAKNVKPKGTRMACPPPLLERNGGYKSVTAPRHFGFSRRIEVVCVNGERSGRGRGRKCFQGRDASFE